MSTTALPPSASVGLTTRDRWIGFIAVTVAPNVISLVLFPLSYTDVATPLQLLACVVPAAWGLYTLFAFRTRKERVAGYISIVPSALWSLCACSLAWQNGWSWMW